MENDKLAEARRQISLARDMLKSCVGTPFTAVERDLCVRHLTDAFHLISPAAPLAPSATARRSIRFKIEFIDASGTVENGFRDSGSCHAVYAERPECSDEDNHIADFTNQRDADHCVAALNVICRDLPVVTRSACPQNGAPCTSVDCSPERCRVTSGTPSATAALTEDELGSIARFLRIAARREQDQTGKWLGHQQRLVDLAIKIEAAADSGSQDG